MTCFLCNLGFPYAFLESQGSIDYCYAFGFLGPPSVLYLADVKRLRGEREGRKKENAEVFRQICRSLGQKSMPTF